MSNDWIEFDRQDAANTAQYLANRAGVLGHLAESAASVDLSGLPAGLVDLGPLQSAVRLLADAAAELGNAATKLANRVQSAVEIDKEAFRLESMSWGDHLAGDWLTRVPVIGDGAMSITRGVADAGEGFFELGRAAGSVPFIPLDLATGRGEQNAAIQLGVGLNTLAASAVTGDPPRGAVFSQLANLDTLRRDPLRWIGQVGASLFAGYGLGRVGAAVRLRSADSLRYRRVQLAASRDELAARPPAVATAYDGALANRVAAGEAAVQRAAALDLFITRVFRDGPLARRLREWRQEMADIRARQLDGIGERAGGMHYEPDPIAQVVQEFERMAVMDADNSRLLALSRLTDAITAAQTLNQFAGIVGMAVPTTFVGLVTMSQAGRSANTRHEVRLTVDAALAADRLPVDPSASP